MNAFETISWKQKLACATLTLGVALGALELVAGSMQFPDPAAVAQRQQVLAAQSERALQLRMLAAGEIKVAATTGIDRL